MKEKDKSDFHLSTWQKTALALWLVYMLLLGIENYTPWGDAITHKTIKWLGTTLTVGSTIDTIFDPSQWAGAALTAVAGEHPEVVYLLGFVFVWPLICLFTWFILTDEERHDNYTLQFVSAVAVVLILAVRGTFASWLAWSLFVPLLFFALFLLAIVIVSTLRKVIRTQHFLLDACLQATPLVLFLLLMMFLA